MNSTTHLERPLDLGLVQTSGRKVHEHVEAAVLLGVGRNADGLPLSASAGPPRDVDEERVQVLHPVYALVEVVEAGLRFGGEELEGVVRRWRGGRTRGRRGGGDVAPLRGQVVRGGRAAHTRREGPIISRQSLTKRQDLFDYLRHLRSDA